MSTAAAVIGISSGLVEMFKGIGNSGHRRKVAAGMLRADEENLLTSAAEIEAGESPFVSVRAHLEKVAEAGETLDAGGIRMLIAMIDVATAAERKARAQDARMLRAIAARSDAISDTLTKED